MISMEQALDYLVERISNRVKSSALSDIVERLLWCLDEDSEKAIFSVRDKWLNGCDLRRVEVALFMQESFPFDDRDEMVRQCSRIVRLWPHLKDRCEEVLNEWDEYCSGREKT